MLIDTMLVGFVMVLIWRWHPLADWRGDAPCGGPRLLRANAIKIPEGGWFPIAMALVSFTVLTTWRRGVAGASGDRRRHPAATCSSAMVGRCIGSRARRCS